LHNPHLYTFYFQ